MVSKIINEWLEEAFTVSGKDKNGVKLENSMIPVMKDGNGFVQTPKPLFTKFLEEIKLEPDFLPHHLDDTEKKILSDSSLYSSKYSSFIGKDQTGQAQLDPELQYALIEYDRNDIFLSRIMFNLFEMPDTSVPKGSAQYPNVVERNEFYQKALEKHERIPEIFTEQSVQTDFTDSTEKQIETLPIIIKNQKCLVNTYLMEKHYELSEMKTKPPPKSFVEFTNSRTKFNDYGKLLNEIDKYPDILDRFKEALYVLEKTLNYNTFKSSVLKYNGCKSDISDFLSNNNNLTKDNGEFNDKTKEHPNCDIECHLQFHLETMKNHYRVTCIECSPINPSIFVVGYGVSRFEEMNYNPRGMLLCWNIHKCGYPEKIFHTEEIVTCLEFSRTEPYLIAVGMRYGLISLFDLRKTDLFSSINNYSSKGRPSNTIKSIRWLKKKYTTGKETEELLSVSMNGVICCWSYGRELDGHILRYIKRGANNMEQQKMTIAIDAAGMCMQIKPNSNEIFLLGTIEGQSLEANINDLDNYVHVYDCHNGPLYDLQWSPLVPDVFITCGTDRFVHIWQTSKTKPSKSLTLEEVVLKVTWSNTKSTLFAAMSEKKILFFDLSINLHKEIAKLTAAKNFTFRYLTFCPQNDWFLVGQSDGFTRLYELVGISPLEISQEEALKNTFLLD